MSVKSESNNGKKRLYIFPRILCLLIAFGIWVYVMNSSSDKFEKGFTDIPIRVEGVEQLLSDSGFSVFDVSESKVSITVSGTRKEINSLVESDFKAYADVSGLTSAEKNNIPVKVSVPENVTLLSYSPSEIMVYTDKNISVDIPISVNLLSQSISDAFSIRSSVPEFDSVKVTGPEVVLKKVKTAVADVNLGNQWITGSFTHSAPLRLVDDKSKTVNDEFLVMEKESVDVRFEVYSSMFITLTADYLNSEAAGKIASLSLSQTRLKVEGTVESMQSIGSVNIYTATGDETGNAVIKASSIQLPAGVRPSNPDETITVSIVMRPVDTSPVTEPETEPVTEPGTEPISEPVTEQITDTVPGSSTDTNTQP